MIDDDKPLYNVGDRVLVTNPLDFFADDDKTVYTVTAVKYNEKYDVFVYQLNGGSAWTNEAWLEPDLFGPQIIEVDGTETDAKQALMVELDYELASLYDAMVRGDEAEKVRCKRRLAELRVENLDKAGKTN